MKIVVSHLTRMQPGFMCVAGIDLETGAHVRPVIGRERMGSWMLADEGGPFEMSAVVDLLETEYQGAPPEVEDHKFDWLRARCERFMDALEFWKLLIGMAESRFVDIFGTELTPHESGSCSVEMGHGTASLGCLLPQGTPQLRLIPGKESTPRIRLCVADAEMELDLPVTDIRLYGPDHQTPDPALIKAVNRRLQDQIGLLLSVGLTRPYSRTDGDMKRHWLTVNNLHLHDDPGWRLGR